MQLHIWAILLERLRKTIFYLVKKHRKSWKVKVTLWQFLLYKKSLILPLNLFFSMECTARDRKRDGSVIKIIKATYASQCNIKCWHAQTTLCLKLIEHVHMPRISILFFWIVMIRYNQLRKSFTYFYILWIIITARGLEVWTNSVFSLVILRKRVKFSGCKISPNIFIYNF